MGGACAPPVATRVPKRSQKGKISHPVLTPLWVLFRTFSRLFWHTFCDPSPEGLLDDFFGPKGAKMELSRGGGAYAIRSCLRMFREGSTFLQKVASGSAPGRHFNDSGAVLEPFSLPFRLILADFCPPFLHAILQALFGAVGRASFWHGGGTAGGQQSLKALCRNCNLQELRA